MSLPSLPTLATATELLLILDFDGTLAHFSDHPTDVRAVPGAMDSLRRLAHAPGTTVMVLSGRALEHLSIVTEQPAIVAPADGDIRLVGGHGSEPAERTAESSRTPEQTALWEHLRGVAQGFADRVPGMWVEEKTNSVGLHYRRADTYENGHAVSRDFIAELERLRPELAPFHITDGKDIVEVSVSLTTKGSYVAGYLDNLPTSRHPVVAFAGDDVTDETVFEVLRERGGVGIKIGAGPTAASERLADPEAVRDFLSELAAQRCDP